MTSGTIRSSRGAAHRVEGHGLLMFASVLLMVLGLFNLLDGIAAVARSHVFIANAHYVVGDLRAWGWVALIFGVLQVLAGIGVLRRDSTSPGPSCQQPGCSSWCSGCCSPAPTAS
jgi:uncharacterized membrane protein